MNSLPFNMSNAMRRFKRRLSVPLPLNSLIPTAIMFALYDLFPITRHQIVTITKGLMSFFHFRSKFPHHSGQLSCHTDACAYDRWSRLGHGRQLHTPSTTQHPFIYFFHINGIFTTTSSPYSLSLPFTLIY